MYRMHLCFTHHRFGFIICSLAFVAAVPAVSRGQASFNEAFDTNGPTNSGQWGPSNLISRGWIFRNQSQPIGSKGYFDGYTPASTGQPGWPSPQAGSGYLAVDATSTDFQFGGTVSTWAILPSIANQRAGDTITFYAYELGTSGHIEVRYSASGGTGTGSSVTDVGSFTQLLLDINPVSSSGWTRYSATLPGNGRIALRYRCSFGAFEGGPYTGIDTLSVGVPPPPPCNQPPIPNAGQTVTWAAAGGPYAICTNVTIPAGGTVVVEPGVTLNVQNGFSLTVAGTLRGVGTSSAPINLNAASNYPPMIWLNGTLDLGFANFTGQIRPLSGCTLLLHDCNFSGNGLIWSNGTDSGPMQYVQPYVVLERCTFTNTSLTCSDCLVVFRNSTLNNSYSQILRGYADTTGGVTTIGQPLNITLEALIQPFFIDNVSATGVATGAGLQLSGANFALGPGNNLQNNLYALDVLGGLARGSVLPRAGNVNNQIYAHGGGGQVHYSIWPNLGIPYFLDGQTDNPDRVIDPGVQIEFGPNGGMQYRSTARLAAEGTPEAPITMRALDSSQPWHILSFQSNGEANRLEYCDIRDSQIGVSASDAPVVWVENSLLHDNPNAANANTFGSLFVRKTQFLNNAVGISVTANGGISLNFPTNPNSFAGNGAAIQAGGSQNDARNNWWNSPSGPQSPLNPGGTGDSIVGFGAGNIMVSPFLTQPPNFTNHPPVVRLIEPGYTFDPLEPAYYFEPGQKFILRWTATDDDQIVSQRILMSPSGNYPNAFVVVADLPPTARSYEMTIPAVPFDAAYWGQFIRVVAVDSMGQDGWDEIPCTIAAGGLNGNVTISSPAAGQTLHAGDAVPSSQRNVTGFSGQFPTFTDYLVFEADGSIYLSGGPVGQIPNASSDLVRFWTQVQNNSNDIRWFPGPYITIRHDPRLGFQPPVVQLQTPPAGATYTGGNIVPITWNASAAEGLRSFDIQVSTDGGRFWRTLVVDVPATDRSFNWQLPAIDAGIADARVRVIARDRRFQNSSDGTNRSFAIQPGNGHRPGDLNGDGIVDAADRDIFVNVLMQLDTDPAHVSAADVNGDGAADAADIQAFVGLLM